ncbi:unnamed protein product [Adineta steineri]|uniref:Uncharacterized protein n=1 Tax=Adineta steineri TaxID=433720 RepID=A0A819F7Z7_9BILA|nr:unnamed protein product [Adineta steineri]
MPMREWYIIFCNQDNLNKYSLTKFTLHAQDKIEIDSKQQKSLTIPDRWTIQDITSAYAHLSTRDCQYGSSFENLKTLRGTSTTIISQLSNDNKNCSSYYLFHPYLVVLTGIETTFRPVRIQKFIYSNKIKTKMNQSRNVEVRGNYDDNICGIGQEGTYRLDLWMFPMDNKIAEPIFTFEGAVIQQVQGVQSGRWSMEQIIYDKLNLTTDLPNTDHKTYLNTIIKDYYLIESIQTFNELAAYYAQMAIKDLDLNQQYHPLLNACRSLASTLNEQVTCHLTQLRLIQLIERFPRLKPFLIILNKYGLYLKDILIEENNGLNIFFGDDEIGQTFQQIKTLINNSFENYRLRIFWLSDSHCSDVLPILDLLLNLSQQTSLLTDLHYADSDRIQLANAQQTFNIHITNQTKNLSIIYDETIDLYDSKTLEKIPIESFDIIFSANQLLVNQDLRNCLIDLRRLLVPNDLLLLLELVHIPFYFDLVFGFNDEWWSPDDDNNRALNNIQQWTTLVEQIEGFCIIESTINQNENHAQFNVDSNLNIIASSFIGLARSLITEYERHRLKLIDF